MGLASQAPCMPWRMEMGKKVGSPHTPYHIANYNADLMDENGEHCSIFTNGRIKTTGLVPSASINCRF